MKVDFPEKQRRIIFCITIPAWHSRRSGLSFTTLLYVDIHYLKMVWSDYKFLNFRVSRHVTSHIHLLHDVHSSLVTSCRLPYKQFLADRTEYGTVALMRQACVRLSSVVCL